MRELVNRVQNLRKELDLGYTQRIGLRLAGDEYVRSALGRFGTHLASETLCDDLSVVDPDAMGDPGGHERSWAVEGHDVRGALRPR